MRSFTWCRQELAEHCSASGEHVHICITGPEGRTILPVCGKKAFHQFFDDLDPAAIRRTEAYAKDPEFGEERCARCFTDEQARAMLSFVKDTSEDIIVNCEAGISRSPGVVLALRRFYGGDEQEVFNRAHPNIHVTSTLSRVLREPS